MYFQQLGSYHQGFKDAENIGYILEFCGKGYKSIPHSMFPLY